MKTLNSTIEAVIETINEFAAAGNAFSAYDVTQHIRKLIDQNELLIVNREPKTGNNQFPFFHSQVRPMVVDAMAALHANTFTKQDNGVYITYVPVNTGVQPPPNVPVVNQPAATTQTFLKQNRQDVIDYAKNAAARGHISRTLKQLQGSMKGYNLKHLKDVLESLNVVVGGDRLRDPLNQYVFDVVMTSQCRA